MIVFDSDHLSILQYGPSPEFERLTLAMDQSVDADFATTVISFEEQMRGWLATIHRTGKIVEQARYYLRLMGLIEFYSRWLVAPFDEAAADRFASLRKDGVRIGTMDLKIASIVLSNDGMLLSANLRDFERVPGLRVENWLR